MLSFLQSPLIKYGIVGLIGTVFHFALLVLLVEWGGLHPIAGSATGFIAVLILSYFLNVIWTFTDASEKRTIRQFIKYTIVSCSGLLLNTAVMYAAVELAHLPYLIGQCIITVIVPVHNYVLNRRWTFRTYGQRKGVQE
ncbi:GtrA family protein [Paenibacillus sp. GCM10012307]|uniref:GtrA family protein n=1 Tax=Paenibacillus roseus TaxID=2798579 RepID=A0A934J5W7_9BACL|nr:GtrA family protein [Paenibacillus roseus]MBJ6361356.1 GtrA family protein [Paenibacillus roseus]